MMATPHPRCVPGASPHLGVSRSFPTGPQMIRGEYSCILAVISVDAFRFDSVLVRLIGRFESLFWVFDIVLHVEEGLLSLQSSSFVVYGAELPHNIFFVGTQHLLICVSPRSMKLL